MKEHESIFDFNIRLRDITNTLFILWEKMYEENLVRKILRSLPRKFDMNITSIKESQDLTIMKVAELISYLQKFEFSVSDKS